MENDVRWVQRLANYNKAVDQLSKFIAKGQLNELEEQGLIQSFEYTYELAWNTIKDYYENQGQMDIQGSRDTIRLAFKRGVIKDGEIWMEMIKSRSMTSHTYNKETADEIAAAIVDRYYQEFINLQKKLNELKEKERK